MNTIVPSLGEQKKLLHATSVKISYDNIFSCSPHPYIFFNHDRESMTFLGFLLSQNGDLLNPGTNEVLEEKLIDSLLRGQLKLQGVDFDVNYEKRDRLD
jgi:hypothetical protein